SAAPKSRCCARFSIFRNHLAGGMHNEEKLEMDMNPSAEQKPKLEQVVLTQVIRMNATINGIVAGFLAGCVILIATLWLVIKGGDVVGPHQGLLDQFFPGYGVTWVGSLVGFIYGGLVGFAVGYFVSSTDNMIVALRRFLRSRS